MTTSADRNTRPDPTPEDLDQAAGDFALLASPVRLHILWALTWGESDVGSLASRVGVMLPAVSQHLAKLKQAGMVHARREGRRQVYLIDDPQLIALVHLMMARTTRPTLGWQTPGQSSAGTSGAGAS